MAGLLLAMSLVGFASSLVGLTSTVASAAPSDRVGATEIVVEGNRRVDADTIRQYFKAEPGARLTADEINAGIKALYASGLFQTINVTTQGNRIIVSVVEASVIDRVVFEGNHRMKDEQLQQEIQSKARGTLSKPMVQADTERIIEVYHRNGRFDIAVTPQIIERPNNRVDLIFVINEGEKTGVKEIDFVGNHAYSSSRLKDVIKTDVSNFLSFLQTTDVYDPDRIEADRDLLRRFYLKHGYADVQVISATGVYDPARKGFIITFTIEEGPQYHFGAIEVQSNVRAVDGNTLRPVVLTHKGDVYNGDAVEKTVEDLTIEMARRGYPFGNVRPRGDRDPQTRTIGVTYVVDEGTRAYIERINIIGNTRTRDYVIRREIDVNEGDPYNRALLDRAERRIKNLNFFKDVKITSEPGSAPDRVVVNINLVEQSTGDFSIMGGYSTAQGWMVEASVSERNLLGTGRFAKASATYGEYIRSGEIDYVEPYFLDDRIGAGISVFGKQTLANSYFSYGTESIGGSLKFGVPLREDFSVQLRYSLYTQSIQLPSYLNDCNNINPDFATTFPTFNAITAATSAGTLWPSYQSWRQSRLLHVRAGLVARACGTGSRHDSDIERGLRSRLQHGRQQQESDQRRQPQFRSGFCGRRRRRSVHAHSRGLAQLLRTGLRSHRRRPFAGGRHPGLPEVPDAGYLRVQQRLCAHARRLQDGAQCRSRICARRHRSPRQHAGNVKRPGRRHDVLGGQPGIRISALLYAEGFRIYRRRIHRFRFGVGLPRRNAVADDWRSQRHGSWQCRQLCLPVRHAIGGFARRARLGGRKPDLEFAVWAAAFRSGLSVPQTIV